MVWVCMGWIDSGGAFRYFEHYQSWRTAYAGKARIELGCPHIICWVETEATRAAFSACAKSGPG